MELGEIQRDLIEIAHDLETATWTATVSSDPVVCYDGSGERWIFVVARWEQAGHVGYDGSAVKGGLIMRLPPELAQKAFQLAASYQNANGGIQA